LVNGKRASKCAPRGSEQLVEPRLGLEPVEHGVAFGKARYLRGKRAEKALGHIDAGLGIREGADDRAHIGLLDGSDHGVDKRAFHADDCLIADSSIGEESLVIRSWHLAWFG